MWDAIIIKPFVNFLLFIYNLVGNNFGLAIILFTLIIRLITHPLTVQQMKGTQGMQDMQKDKKWIDAQKKYKDDQEKLAQVQMELYKEYGVNPFASCLPTLIQFPIILGLYQSIMITLATSPLQMLKLISYIYPGFLSASSLLPLNSHFLWMNLGQPESLHIPGVPFGIPILAIVVIVTTYLQSKLTTPPSTTSDPNDQTAQMTRSMNLMMPIMMGWLALTLSSGLAVYFVTSNLVGIIQYSIMGKSDWSNVFPGLKKKEQTKPEPVKVKAKAKTKAK